MSTYPTSQEKESQFMPGSATDHSADSSPRKKRIRKARICTYITGDEQKRINAFMRRKKYAAADVVHIAVFGLLNYADAADTLAALDAKTNHRALTHIVTQATYLLQRPWWNDISPSEGEGLVGKYDAYVASVHAQELRVELGQLVRRVAELASALKNGQTNLPQKSAGAASPEKEDTPCS